MNAGLIKTFVAASAVTARRIVKFTAAGKIEHATAGTDNSVGVSNRVGDVAADDRVDVHLSRTTEVEAGAAIAYGVSVAAGADGKAVPAVAGDVAVGFAVGDATADGDILDILLVRHKV